jgi:hypothetical protein
MTILYQIWDEKPGDQSLPPNALVTQKRSDLPLTLDYS